METPSPPPPSSSSSSHSIPIEIISEEEMAFLEAALASTRPRPPLIISSAALSPSRRRHVTTSIRSSRCHVIEDIEDSRKPKRSFLERFRTRRALTVTDITGAEWCEKKMEYSLIYGKPKKTAAMEAGFNRHAELEKEIRDGSRVGEALASGPPVSTDLCILITYVIEKIEIHTRSLEEIWVVKFFTFIVGAKQLLFEGLTRELPVIGVFGNAWIVGVIDELRMPINQSSLNPILVDTKTRYKATLPAEAQKRNARLQLMCYKHLYDGLVAGTFPTEYFLKYFELNPHYILSEEVKQYTASLGFDTKTFEDAVTCFRDSCSFLLPSQDQLLLRYELQSDCSLLEEHVFANDAGWLKIQLEENLKFWLGEKEAIYVPMAESWKCRFCTFNTFCPLVPKPASQAK